ncbi:hypothetical protein [Roseomonas haemaphysalidis]|uniref:DUF4175 domain-containing protein n=1 Tax=Roseomonas haemaphysalidis TaxID=2768162 RepID=A0ABS3KND5_9PROT|nr:hypothetical protein [Roseomonas haemaphysalidis]MBO1078967.1 hypothetical protein [Roseomonas haemaphysalidis]
MRLFLVVLSVLVALALWVWATGPGTTLWLAAGGWIFCAVVGRVTFLLLRQKGGDTDTGPGVPPTAAAPPESPSTVVHPTRRP